MPKSGRPKSTTEAQRTAFLNVVRTSPFSAVTRTASQFDIGRMAARNILKKAKLYCCRAARRTTLTRQHRDRRIQFCMDMLASKDHGFDFESIVFTDEKTFCSVEDRNKLVYRPRNARFQPQYVSYNQLSGRISCGYWGWISCAGPGVLVRLNGRFNSAQYIDILETAGVPSIETIFGATGNVAYMHDNSPVHTARAVRCYLESLEFDSILNWPALSPDLNPIENIWAKVTRGWPTIVEDRQNQLERLIQERWLSLENQPGMIYDTFSNKIFRAELLSLFLRNSIFSSFRLFSKTLRLVREPISICNRQ